MDPAEQTKASGRVSSALECKEAIVGFAYREDSQGCTIEVLLRDAESEKAVKKTLEALVPEFPRKLRLDTRVTGAFTFAATNIQSEIDGGGLNGKVGLFLTNGTHRFALSCAHVLDGGNGTPVEIEDSLAGEIACQIRLSTARPTKRNKPANEVDCALAVLNKDFPAKNLRPDKKRMPRDIGSCREGDELRFIGNRQGVVILTRADVELFYEKLQTDIGFNDLILVRSQRRSPLVDYGDSGSLVTDSSGRPVGIVVAKGPCFRSTADRKYIPASAAFCDLNKILRALNEELEKEEYEKYWGTKKLQIL